MLQPQAVAQIDGKVGQHQQQAVPPVAERRQLDGQRGGQQEGRQPPGLRDGHRPGGDGPGAFDLMLPVGLHIPDVVEHIHRRGQQAEGPEAQQGLGQHGGAEQVPVEGDGDQDEEVFDIVPGPHQPQDILNFPGPAHISPSFPSKFPSILT